MRLFYFYWVGKLDMATAAPGSAPRPNLKFEKRSCEAAPCSHLRSSVPSSIKIVVELLHVLHVLCAFFINLILMLVLGAPGRAVGANPPLIPRR
jgi:hypothetical protein